MSLFYALALAPALAGCGDDAEPAKLVSKRIGPEGGIVSSHDGVLTIILQAGALPEDAVIEIFPSDLPPLVFGPAYRVRPNVPLEIDAEIEYRRVLPEDPTDTAIAAIRLEDYENERGWWRPLPRIALDVEHDSVLALDSELSLYYALVEDADGPGDAGTGSESTSSDEDASESSAGASDSTGVVALSHELDIQPIWQTYCLGPGCHEPPSPGGGLVLAGDAYASIVDVLATGANRPYIAPGDPDGSYIVNKLDGSFDDPEVNGSGSPMPLAMEALPADELALIRAWIEQGAAP